MWVQVKQKKRAEVPRRTFCLVKLRVLAWWGRYNRRVWTGLIGEWWCFFPEFWCLKTLQQLARCGHYKKYYSLNLALKVFNLNSPWCVFKSHFKGFVTIQQLKLLRSYQNNHCFMFVKVQQCSNCTAQKQMLVKVGIRTRNPRSMFQLFRKSSETRRQTY